MASKTASDAVDDSTEVDPVHGGQKKGFGYLDIAFMVCAMCCVWCVVWDMCMVCGECAFVCARVHML